MQMTQPKESRRPSHAPISLAWQGITPPNLFGLVVVMFLRALCFPLISLGLMSSPPLTFATLRSLVAGAGLLLPAYALRRATPRGWKTWLSLLGIGFTITSLGFAGMFLAGDRVSPGLATVLANSQPLVAAGLAYFVLGERLGKPCRAGLSLGFAGIILVALPGFYNGNINNNALGIGYILLGVIGVAVGNVLLKRLAGQVDVLMAVGWQFLLGSIPLFLAAQAFETPVEIARSPSFVMVLLALGLLGTAVAFVGWFSLLGRAELNRLNTFTFLTPLFALMIAAALWGERLGLFELGGTVLILASMLWVSLGRSSSVVEQNRVHE